MKKSETSRVKRDSEAESILLAACRKATQEGRPFTIRHGYDRELIGAYSEFEIWHEDLQQ